MLMSYNKNIPFTGKLKKKKKRFINLVLSSAKVNYVIIYYVKGMMINKMYDYLSPCSNDTS